MRDYLDIIKRNLLSPIVVVIFLLAGALVYVREYRDAWFISVVIVVNSTIGIVQELRAKRVLRQLELMSAPKARLLRDGNVVEVGYGDLKIDDEIIIQAGDELPADAKVIESKGLELNESMLTGESASIEKKNGDVVLAATTVLAGEGMARVIAVGDDTKAGAISQVLRRYKPELTPLQLAIWRAIYFLTYGAIILSLLIAIVYYFSGDNVVIILKTITSAAVTVVPEGLLLASSLLLAFGSLRLAQAKVLPQKLSAIEAMALLNLLAVDKTGTLTSDEVSLEKVALFGDDFSSSDVASFAALIAHETSGGNITGRAILAEAAPPKDTEIVDVMAFSSARKMAGVRARVNGTVRTLIMGAPEFVSKLAPVDKETRKKLNDWADKGLRVLMMAEFADEKTKIKDLKEGSGMAIGAVILRNSLRHGVVETVDFLQRQGVTIRVISGDNPRTVQYIAREAGIKHPEKVILGEELVGLSDDDFDKAADTYTIFARVLPDQKERLIARFQQSGKFTGMVGDGVNDALALKKADLGVAMYAGAPASRRVSDIILLNNSFTSLPMGMKLGNQIMQAIEVIAILFFHKIIYGVTLLLTTILINMNYPYSPRHITFMNIFLVTMPTLMWTLFPPMPKHRINPKRFWRDTLLAVLPIALLTGLTVAFTYWIMSVVFPGHAAEVATMTVLTATFFGVYLVFLVGIMLDVTIDKAAKRARLLYLLSVVVVAAGSFGFGFLRDFFDFTVPNLFIMWPAIGVIILATLTQLFIARRVGRRISTSVG
jgi:HAD ATPase, P-type, family IC